MNNTRNSTRSKTRGKQSFPRGPQPFQFSGSPYFARLPGSGGFNQSKGGSHLNRVIIWKTSRAQQSTNKYSYLHAAAGCNLTSISEPGDLRLGKAANSWRRDDSALSLRDWLAAFTLLETSHDYRNKQTIQTKREKKVRKDKGQAKSQVQISLFFHVWLLVPTVLLPSAFSSGTIHWTALMDSALLLPWFPQCIKKG